MNIDGVIGLFTNRIRIASNWLVPCVTQYAMGLEQQQEIGINDDSGAMDYSNFARRMQRFIILNLDVTASCYINTGIGQSNSNTNDINIDNNSNEHSGTLCKAYCITSIGYEYDVLAFHKNNSAEHSRKRARTRRVQQQYSESNSSTNIASKRCGNQDGVKSVSLL